MIKTENSLKIPDWSGYHVNRWADYIEFRCLYIDDHIITKDDVLDLFFDEDILDLQRGQSVHSANYDKLSTNIDNYYEVIKYRNEMFNACKCTDRIIWNST